MALCLHSQGKYAEALSLFRKALALRQKVLGEQHPHTAASYNNLASCLNSQGKHAEAIRSWEKRFGAEWSRLQANTSGFDRSLYNVGFVSPRSALAACLVRVGKPHEAWQHAEADLARGLLDDLLPSGENTADTDRRARLHKLDQILLPLFSRAELIPEATAQRDALIKERDDLLAELAANAARRLAGASVAAAHPEAVPRRLAWSSGSTSVTNTWLACSVNRGRPPGSSCPAPARTTPGPTTTGSCPVVSWRRWPRAAAAPAQLRLLAQLHRQRVAPLESHLQGVRQLLVVAAGQMSAVPVEALTERYTISYVPSASVFARGAEQHRPLKALLFWCWPIPSSRAPLPCCRPRRRRVS